MKNERPVIALLFIALIWALSQFGDMAYLDFVR
jgi:hypothetical protein